MTARGNRPDSPPPPLSKWIIRAGTLVVLVVAVVVAVVSWFVLRRLYGGQGAQVQLDVIRTAGTLVIGIGGAVALLLTARRQRYIELTLVHTDRDATERRITELYTKAADQLGSEQAPVRLAGLYALERLAHSTVEHRQTMVDVICAYLRMPYTPPQPSSYRSPGPARRRRTLTDRPPHATPTSRGSRHEHAQQERQVRLTAQDILFRNLRVVAQRRRRWWHRTPPPVAPTWPGIRLNLTGALLLEFSLKECQLDYANFTRAQFTGGTDFADAQFTGGTDFEGAQFTGGTYFWSARVSGGANFKDAQFTDGVSFQYAQFTGETSFEDVRFTDGAYFAGTRFNGETYFGNVRLTGETYFVGAQFTGETSFEDVRFTGGANFEGARVASAAGPGSVWPPGWTTRPAKPDNGEDPAFLYLTKAEESPTSVMGT
ncbi:MAG: pentapeptide repeat-containing protein [Pseudonocardiaceae bacterium]